MAGQRIRPDIGMLVMLGMTLACSEASDPLAGNDGDAHNEEEVVVPTDPPLPIIPTFAAARLISVTSLGTLGNGAIHFARDINSHNVVVGESADNSDNPRAFAWSASTGIIDLGTTGGSQSTAAAINDLDQIIGTSYDVNEVEEAFVYFPGVGMRGVGSIIGGVQSRGFSLSNQGHFVGDYMPVAFDPMNPGSFRGIRAWVFTIGSGFFEIPTLGSQFAGGFAFDVNDAGVVTGITAAGDAGEPFEGYTWSATGGMQALGSMGGNFSEHITYAINDAGEVSGGALNDATSLFHPFWWSPQTGFTDLKTLGFPADASGFAIDINRFGHMPVLIQEGTGTRTPTVWVRGVGSVTLPTLGGTDGEIWAMNDLGVIAGWSEDGAGNMKPVIWRVEFSPTDRIQDAMDLLAGIRDTISNGAIASELDNVVGHLQDALDALASNDARGAINDLRGAVDDLVDAINDGLDPILGESMVEVIVEAARDIAVAAIDDAIARGGSPTRISRAQNHLADGDADRANGEWENAVRDYRRAVQDALRA